jgi:phosphate acetyltransferase
MNGSLENHTFEEIEVGDSASVQHTLTRKDIQLFAVMSGDVNPSHVDREYAESDMFHHIVAHGMWTGSLISTVLGTQLPGPGTIYLKQTFQFLKPVVVGDTITASVTVISKDQKKKSVELDCVCVNQDGKEVIKGVASVLAPTEKVKRAMIKLPKLEFKGEPAPKHLQIISMAKGLEPLLTAVVHPVDKLSLEGAMEAHKAKLIRAILVGPEDKIKAAAKEAGIDISGIPIIGTLHSHDSAQKAVVLVNDGKAEAIMKGDIHTDELLHPILSKETGLQTGRRLSHIAVVDTPAYPRVLFITDAAVNIFPTLSDKVDIVQNAIDLFHTLGLGTPRVAILSAVETVNEHIPSTLDATALCKMAERGQITGGILDGPLAFDNALSEEAARIKNIQSQVAGKADILVVPDVESGNMLFKEFTLLLKATMSGIVMGAKVPIILTSRSSDVFSRKASCALAVLSVRNKSRKTKE